MRPHLLAVAWSALALAALCAARPLETQDAFADATTAEKHRFVEAQLDYPADSGGCQPLTNYLHDDWWDWEKRLPKLASKVSGVAWGERAATVLEALGRSNYWMQVVDGWAQPQGASAFGAAYVQDASEAQDMCASLLRKGVTKDTLGFDFYNDMHSTAFKQTAKELGKTNGLRGPNSWIILPLPDKPLGVFHDIHDKGKKTYDTDLRKVAFNSDQPTGRKYNNGYLMRWAYPNKELPFMRDQVTKYWNEFWGTVNSVDPKSSLASKRWSYFVAIVDLYHNLENFHCFVDGNGRTNYLILNMLLSWAGLHPVSLYNTMESALSSKVEERQRVLQGYFQWEQSYLNVQSGKGTSWTLPVIAEKNKECQVAIDALFGRIRAPTNMFLPDTEGGCMCKNVRDCHSNSKRDGRPWCNTDSSCTWDWDYCAREGRGPSQQR